MGLGKTIPTNPTDSPNPSILPRHTESTPLLGNPTSADTSTWITEMKVLGRYSGPFIIANLLQFSINISSLLIISPRGKLELGAVSVATTTANITGFIVYQGLSTSLDTLCAQAYGSGNRQLALLHVKSMILLLTGVSIPIAVLWFYANHLFSCILPDVRTSMLAGLYLRVLIFAMPGFVTFEAGKRILTAEGRFLPVMGILCAGACTNVFLGWLLVWRCGFGFIGAPIAVATTWTLISMYFLLYHYLTGKREMQPFKTSKALIVWGPMLKLALPGLVMVEAEYLAFEILIFASAQLSTANLAAHTILVTLNSAFWQIPYSMSIAGTTMIAQHIGAKSASLAKVGALVIVLWSFVCSATNGVLLFSFRGFWPTLFTDDPTVFEAIQGALPLVALMQLFDGMAACFNGMLRGIGRPGFGSLVNLVCYYLVALPVSLWTTFKLGLGLIGLWLGVTIALVLVTVAEVVFLLVIDWQKSVDDAVWRNSLLDETS